jgi:hypothetical protein
MTQANPYQSFVGDRDPSEVMRETPRRLRELVDGLGAPGLERSLGPGKWPVRTILSHLADCEVAFGYRIRQVLAVDNYEMQPFDQEKWARPYDTFSGQHALEVFIAVRGWNLALLKTLLPQDLERKTSHPERGAMTLRTLLESIAGHDLNHLQQVERIRGL